MPHSFAPEPGPSLPFTLLRQVDLLCDNFERAWQDGTPRSIQDFLDTADPLLLPTLREELLKLEVDYRSQRGDHPRAEEYLGLFPECAGSVPAWLQQALATADAPTTGSDLVAQSSTVDHSPAVETPSVASEAPAAPLPAVLGEYELLGPLGAGGMGEVYRARHRRLGKLVALKVLRETRLASAEALARFRREMAAVGQLDHPHLVEAYDAGEQDGIVYLVLKLIDGVDLHRLVQERGPLPVAEACDLVRQAALGLQHLHERSLVHRDIKPSNLMRTPSGTVKVIDLGLARWECTAAADQLTPHNTGMGTPDYVAPEQITGPSGVDIRADLYSLGATLFCLLIGKPPFCHREDVLAKLHAHASETPADVRSLRPEVPDAVAALVARLLEKGPEQRFAAPQELADALAPFTRGAAAPSTLPEAPARRPEQRLPTAQQPADTLPARPRRRRRKLLIVAAGLLLAPLAVWAALYLMNRAGGPVGDDGWEWELLAALYPRNRAGGPGASSSPDLQDDRLVLRIWSKDGSKKGLRIGVDPGALPARPEDRIRAEVRLNQPAHIYLLGLSAQGEVMPLYPWHRDLPRLDRTLNDPPPEIPPQKELTWPSEGSVKGLELDDSSGLETIVLLARRTPLPADVSLAELVGPQPLPAAPLGHREEFVLRGGDEGQGVDAVRYDLHRGFQKELRDIDEPLEQLLGRLHGEFELLRAVRFAHQGK
jgi:serine/threonine protein kinase